MNFEEVKSIVPSQSSKVKSTKTGMSEAILELERLAADSKINIDYEALVGPRIPMGENMPGPYDPPVFKNPYRDSLREHCYKILLPYNRRNDVPTAYDYKSIHYVLPTEHNKKWFYEKILNPEASSYFDKNPATSFSKCVSITCRGLYDEDDRDYYRIKALAFKNIKAQGPAESATEKIREIRLKLKEWKNEKYGDEESIRQGWSSLVKNVTEKSLRRMMTGQNMELGEQMEKGGNWFDFACDQFIEVDRLSRELSKAAATISISDDNENCCNNGKCYSTTRNYEPSSSDDNEDYGNNGTDYLTSSYNTSSSDDEYAYDGDI